MTREQIEQRIEALKAIMEQNYGNLEVIVHCANKIAELREKLEKPIIYLPPK